MSPAAQYTLTWEGLLKQQTDAAYKVPRHYVCSHPSFSESKTGIKMNEESQQRFLEVTEI